MLAQNPTPIAIIGIGCRLPGGVTDTEKLWDLLVDGRNTWSAVPDERFNEEAFYHPDPDHNGTTNHRGGHFIKDNVAAFDAAFFGISPVEARAMDPQQRLLLETTYETFEDAGIPIEKISGSNTAVYAAIFTRDYDRNIYRDHINIPKYHVTGSGEAILSNRISYIFDLKGPSMTLDTGCSGSMVAVHQACQSLRCGESDMALASGVNLILNADHMIGMSNLHMLSDTGRSYPFDSRGSGYGRGEGVVSILLKRLDDALRAGDHVRAIIRNSAVNQDGKTSGITLPNQQAQERLGSSVYEYAHLDPTNIHFIEAHGTGTAAGDLTEMRAIANVFCHNGRRRDSLYVGSIKSNIGHLESSSGLAGLIKTVLVLEKGLIPPNADFKSSKKDLNLEEWKIKIPSKLESWPTSGTRQASVNSFGYGGTNAHIILESASSSTTESEEPENPKVLVAVEDQETQHAKNHNSEPLTALKFARSNYNQDDETRKELEMNGLLAVSGTNHIQVSGTTKDTYCVSDNQFSVTSLDSLPHLFVLSAKSEQTVMEVAKGLHKWGSMRCDFERYMTNLAHTLSTRRSMMQWRYSFVAASYQDFMTSLDQILLGTNETSSSLRIGMIFTGQGAQWYAMGRDLIFRNSRFKESLVESSKILRRLGAAWSLIDELLRDEPSTRINQSDVAQPTTTALQIGLVDLLDAFGVKAQMVLGHSSGEIAAAYAAGILSHIDALRVSYCRSFISSFCNQVITTKGAMLSVGLSEDNVLPLLRGTQKGIVSLACVNSPSSTTISGDEAAIAEIQEKLDHLGIFNRKLKVDTAYHSHHMRKVADLYLSSLGIIEERPIRVGTTFVSTVTAAEKTAFFGSAYWVENLVSKVRFCDALQTYCRMQLSNSQSTMVHDRHILIEVGPHTILGGPIRQSITQGFEEFDHVYIPTLVRNRNALQSILELVGKLFEHGYAVNLDVAMALSSERRPRLIRDLPTYPWDHSNTYWHESRLSKNHRLRPHPYHDLLGTQIPSSTSLEPSWRHLVGVENLPWLAEHVIDDLVIFPGAGYICMAIEAIRQATHDTQTILKFILTDVIFLKALVIPPAPATVEIQLSLRTRQCALLLWHEFRIFAFSPDETWHEHCHGLIRTELASHKIDSHQHDLGEGTELADKELSGAINARSLYKLNSETIYTQLRSNGNHYGPHFAAINELELNELRAIGHVNVPDVRCIMPAKYMEPHIIHPTTLDALMHSSLPLYARRYGPGSIMPVAVGGITVSAAISSTPGTTLTVSTTLTPNGIRSAMADISVFIADWGIGQEPMVVVSQVELRGFGTVWTGNLDSLATRNMCYQMNWAPDVDYILDRVDVRPRSLATQEYLKHLSFKRSSMTVLEIEAGVGRTCISILQDLNDQTLLPIKRYDFTDLSPDLFELAQDTLGSWSDLVYYKTLNIQQDPVLQGFSDHAYDLIIAGSSLEAKSNLDTVLMNIHQLLKPEGRFIVLTEIRSQKLNEVVRQCSFTSNELTVDHWNRPGTIIVSKPVAANSSPLISHVEIIVEESLNAFATDVSLVLGNRGFQTSLATWETYLYKSETIYVILDDGQTPVLRNSASNRFMQIAKLLRGKTNVFWISAHDDINAAFNPAKGIVIGLARCARAENDALRFITFDVQQAIKSCLPALLHSIADVISNSFNVASQSDQLDEVEYTYRNDTVFIPRLVPDVQMNTWMSQAAGKPIFEAVSYCQPQRALKLNMNTPGSVESLHFIYDDSVLASLDPTMVEIAVKSHGLTSKDFKNLVGDKSSLSICEFAGTITAVGSKASNRFQVGNRVCGWSYNKSSLASRIQIPGQNIAHLPDSIPLAIGAVIPVSFMSAHYMLVELANLQRGQTILVHGAAKDIGRAALTIGNHVGAYIFAIVSSVSEKDELVKRSKLSSTQIFIDGQSYKKNVSRLTRGNGVDVILNTSAVGSVLDPWDCISFSGICLQLDQLDAGPAQHLRIPRLEKNITFKLFDLTTLIVHRPQELDMLLGKIMPVIELDSLVPYQPMSIMSIADVGSVFDATRTLNHNGKMVFQADEDTRVNILNTNYFQSRLGRYGLETEGTYIVAGGMGDLGQKVCHLMVSRGAKHIVVLSRSPLSHEKSGAIQENLRLILPDLMIYAITCDISDLSKVQEVAYKLEEKGLPPVKGVVHSAAVLQDRSLETMTADGFQVPLKTKLYGTQNLEKVFHSPHLEFFVMLSSISGIVGTKGQANYAAGNTFQDALAQSQMKSKTRYLALDLGLIENTKVYEEKEGRARVQNLLRHGFIPITFKELLAFLDYAFCTEVGRNQHSQVIFGIDGRSLFEAENEGFSGRNALFTHVRSSYDRDVKNENDTAHKSNKEIAKGASSLLDFKHIISMAIAQQLSRMLAIDYEKINLQAPVLDLGLDSLIAIDLKNWISREFDSAIQASEILDEASVITLAERVASRSSLVRGVSIDDSIKIKSDVGNRNESATSETKDTTSEANAISFPLLPQVPLPSLEGTLELYLTSARPFLPKHELKDTCDAIANFLSEIGPQLQNRLTLRTQDPHLNGWQHDLQVKSIYLKRRDPIYPFGIFYGVHVLTHNPHSQADRAAIISAAAFQFKRLIDSDRVKQDYLNEEPLCMNSLQWLFNVSRKPGIGVDEMCKFPRNDYLVALRRGYIFKVLLTKNSHDITYRSLQVTFQAILESSSEMLPPVAALTADNRDSWAELRETVKTIHPTNDALISMIEAAAFVICLDDGSPTTPTERCNQFLLGDPSNRWSDKSLQFVVCANGVSGYICEHSMLDAASLKQINNFVTQAIFGPLSEMHHNANGYMNGDAGPETSSVSYDSIKDFENLFQRYSFITNKVVDSHITRVQEHFRMSHVPAEFFHFRLPSVNLDFLNIHKIPSKTGCQLVIQLASLLYFGQQHPSWETLTMMPFHNGRLDWIQVVSPTMFQFCKAIIDPNIPETECKKLLRESASTHTNTMMRIGRGKGFMAHLEALREVMDPHESVPALFMDPTWEKMRVTSSRKIKTDTSEGLVAQEAGFLMPDPESVFVHYEIIDGGCIFWIQSTQGRTVPFCDALTEAAERVKRCLEKDII